MMGVVALVQMALLRLDHRVPVLLLRSLFHVPAWCIAGCKRFLLCTLLWQTVHEEHVLKFGNTCRSTVDRIATEHCSVILPACYMHCCLHQSLAES